MRNLLDISRDNLRREKTRSRNRLAGVVCLFLATALVIGYSALFVTEQRNTPIFLKETVGKTEYLYVEQPGTGHLLKLKCAPGVEVEPADGTPIYRLDCRWNRRTYKGTVTRCERIGGHIVLGSLMDVTFEPESAPIFGVANVYFTSENYYPDPYAEERGREFLCDCRFWTESVEDGTNQTLLIVKDCKNAIPADYDGDGVNEVVVRTRWPEKPYTVYDMVDGEIVETWPDELSPELEEQLRAFWE